MSKAERTAPYNFDLKLSDDKYEVQVDTAACYGWFENAQTGSGGGLWFEVNAEGKRELIDADGTYCLPASVARQLRAAGLIVSENFE
jgi:hypothetical protein